MILDNGQEQYEVVRDVFVGKDHVVSVCKYLQSVSVEYKVIWLVKNRELAKKIIGVFSKTVFFREKEKSIFTYQDAVCFVLPYEEERPLMNFYLATVRMGVCSGQQIWQQLLVKCMSSELPKPILYLILRQRQIKISQDGNIYFQYELDVTELNPAVTEAECTMECARIIRELMDLEHVSTQAAVLIDRKLKRKGYIEFIDLYKDIKIMIHQEAEIKKTSFREKIESRKDNIFRLLLVMGIILLVIVIVIAVLQWKFQGDSAFRIFHYSVDQIGTESLLQ
nr:MAG TPA_asm: hypothetical protein [Caudoviricetes sp.]